MQERRATEILRTYWESIRGTRPMPSWEEVDYIQIGYIWDSCFLVQIEKEHNELVYRYSYIGKDIEALFKRNLTGVDVAQFSEQMLASYRKVAETKEPGFEETEFKTGEGELRLRQMLVPLGRDGRVDHVLGVVGWRAYVN